MMEGPSRVQKVGDFWSEEAARRARGAAEPLIDWTMSKRVREIINRRVSGADDVDWLAWIQREYCGGGLGLALSVGCGIGGLERQVMSRGMCRRMVGVDIAEGALDKARESAGGMAIEYKKVDLERETVPGGPYDAVFAAATLHHVNALGRLAANLHSALRPGGYLFVFEFVGPSRFQWTPEQLRLVGDIHSLLPWRYRMHFQAGGTVPFPERTPPCSMIRSDPSEAVRSAEIEEVLARWFEVVESRRIGGTILNPLLGGILESFDESCDIDRTFIETVGDLEDALIEADLLPSDFKVLVYRRRGSVDLSDGIMERELGRSGHIARQEREIARLHQRFLDLDEECERLRGEIADTDMAAVRLGGKIAEAVEANASHKRGALFRVLRGARGGSGAEKPAPGEGDEPETRDAWDRSACPAAFSGADRMASALGRAAGHYAENLGRGGDVLWLSWLSEVLPVPVESVLAVGLEPGVCGIASKLGPLDEAQAPGGGCFTPPVRGPYELVLLAAPARCENARAARALVAEGGWLVSVKEPGRPGGPEVTREPESAWSPVARESFTLSCHARAADALADAPAGKEREARALAGLIVYADSVMARAGLVPGAIEVEVLRKDGAQDRPRPTEAVTDIVVLQDREIDRLTRAVAHRRDVGKVLEKARAEAASRLATARENARSLELEREILERRGALMYWRLMRLKRFPSGRGAIGRTCRRPPRPPGGA